MEATTTTLATILTQIGTFFTQMISWFGDLAETIASNPLLFIFLIAIPVVGFIVSLVLRLIKSRARKG